MSNKKDQHEQERDEVLLLLPELPVFDMKSHRDSGSSIPRKGSRSPTSSSGGRTSTEKHCHSPPSRNRWTEENIHAFPGNTIEGSSHTPVPPRPSEPQSSSASPSQASRPRDYWETVLGPSNETELLGSTNPTPSGRCDKPYPCSVCPLRFKKRCNLLTHISNVHEKVRPFLCSVCFRKFARKSNCVKHVSFIVKCSIFFTACEILCGLTILFTLLCGLEQLLADSTMHREDETCSSNAKG